MMTEAEKSMCSLLYLRHKRGVEWCHSRNWTGRRWKRRGLQFQPQCPPYERFGGLCSCQCMFLPWIEPRSRRLQKLSDKLWIRKEGRWSVTGWCLSCKKTYSRKGSQESIAIQVSSVVTHLWWLIDKWASSWFWMRIEDIFCHSIRFGNCCCERDRV